MRDFVGKLRAAMMRLAGAFRGRDCDADFAAEIDSHLAMHTEDGIRAGLSPEEARRQALMQIGGAEQVRQAHRDRRTLLSIDNLLRDMQYALRQLRKSPGFTLTAVLTLALGMGATTAIFSLIHGALRLPFPDANRLVSEKNTYPNASYIAASYPDFEDWKHQNKSFTRLVAISVGVQTYIGVRGPARIGVSLISGGFFPFLG